MRMRHCHAEVNKAMTDGYLSLIQCEVMLALQHEYKMQYTVSTASFRDVTLAVPTILVGSSVLRNQLLVLKLSFY
jgi:hypothetical protein